MSQTNSESHHPRRLFCSKKDVICQVELSVQSNLRFTHINRHGREEYVHHFASDYVMGLWEVIRKTLPRVHHQHDPRD